MALLSDDLPLAFFFLYCLFLCVFFFSAILVNGSRLSRLRCEYGMVSWSHTTTRRETPPLFYLLRQTIIARLFIRCVSVIIRLELWVRNWMFGLLVGMGGSCAGWTRDDDGFLGSSFKQKTISFSWKSRIVSRCQDLSDGTIRFHSFVFFVSSICMVLFYCSIVSFEPQIVVLFCFVSSCFVFYF